MLVFVVFSVYSSGMTKAYFHSTKPLGKFDPTPDVTVAMRKDTETKRILVFVIHWTDLDEMASVTLAGSYKLAVNAEKRATELGRRLKHRYEKNEPYNTMMIICKND